MNFEQILALLMGKFTGVRKDGLAQIAKNMMLLATTEAEAQALVDKMTVEKVTEAVKDYRKDVDKEITDSTKTHETNLKKKYDFKEKAADSGTPDPAKPDPTDIKALLAEALKPLRDELAGFKGAQVTTSRLQTLEDKLKDLPTTFKAEKLRDFRRMNFDTDESFNEYLTETESGALAFNQELANSGLAGQGKPMFGQKTTDGVSQGVASFIEAKAKPENSLGGKEL